jgi:hypothetical protein
MARLLRFSRQWWVPYCQREVNSAGLVKDENRTEISRTDRFHFLYYDSVFKHKKLSVSIGFTTIFNHFLYSLIAKM